jgi:hypothetical protein
MRWCIALLLSMQLTPCFACAVGPRTFDFGPRGARGSELISAVFVIGRIVEVVPAEEGGDRRVTIEVLRAYSRDPQFSPPTRIGVSASFGGCGQSVAPGDIGLYAIGRQGDGLKLLSNRW